MKNISIQSIVLTIIFTILSVYIEFFCYYFFDSLWIPICVTILFSFIISHITLEITYNYELGFLQILCSFILSTVIIVFVYLNQTSGFIPYKKYMLFLIFLNWFIPFIYYLFRHLLDHVVRLREFNRFFVKSSMIFFLFYTFIIIWKQLLLPFAFPKAIFQTGTYNIIPFWTTASYIEDIIYNKTSLLPLLYYILKQICIFLPFGFYLWLATRKTKLPIRIFIFLLVPFLIELIQLFTSNGYCDIDDYIYSCLGSIGGIILYRVLDSIFYCKQGYGFLQESTNISFHSF